MANAATEQVSGSQVPTVRFDDLERLRSLVSDQFGPWGPEVVVTQEMVNEFADLSGDHQWIHVDVERANRESPFGGPIAHGFLTLIVFPRLRAKAVDIAGHGSAVNYGGDRLRFIAPVPVGATIHGRARLAAADPKAGGTLIASEFEARVVGADRPSMLYSMLALYLP